MAITLPIVSKFDDKGITAAERAIQGFSVAAVATMAAAVTAVAAFGVASVKAAAEAEAVTRGLENAAKNAGVFGDSASAIGRATKALDEHSRSLGEMSGIDDEIINQIKTGWLAVPDLAALGTKGLNRLAEVTADVAAGTGKDVQAIGLAFQKIAGDSETAFSKLTRAGIVFTDEQKATYDSLLATSGEMAAQAYLVDELGRKYEGAAAAAANPFERLQVIFQNLQEDVGAKLLPAFEQFVPIVQQFADSLISSPEFNAFLSEMSTTLVGMLPNIQGMVTAFMDLGINVLPELNPLMEILGDAIGVVATTLGSVNEESPTTISDLEVLAGLIGVVTDAYKDVDSWINTTKNSFDGWGSAFAAVISSVSYAFNPLLWLLREVWALTLSIQGKSAEAARVRGFNVPAQFAGYTPAQQRQHRGMATGGVVASAGLSWVGEKGPELLTMPKGATVTPIPQHMRADAMFGANTSGGNNSFSITVNAGMGADGSTIGAEIVKAIKKYERSSGPVFVSA